MSVASTALVAAAAVAAAASAMVGQLAEADILYNGFVATMVLAEVAQVMALTHNYGQDAADGKAGEAKLEVHGDCSMSQQCHMYFSLSGFAVALQGLVDTDAGNLAAAGIVNMRFLVSEQAIVEIDANWVLVVGFECYAVNIHSRMMYWKELYPVARRVLDRARGRCNNFAEGTFQAEVRSNYNNFPLRPDWKVVLMELQDTSRIAVEHELFDFLDCVGCKCLKDDPLAFCRSSALQ